MKHSLRFDLLTANQKMRSDHILWDSHCQLPPRDRTSDPFQGETYPPYPISLCVCHPGIDCPRKCLQPYVLVVRDTLWRAKIRFAVTRPAVQACQRAPTNDRRAPKP